MLDTSRRSLLRAFAFSPLILALPARRVFAIDPITVLQACAAALSIMRSVSGASDDAAARKAFEEIQAKLDAIISQQVEILNEMRKMRFVLREELLASWLQHESRDIVAHQSRLSILLQESPVTSDVKSRFRDLLDDSMQTTFNVGSMGPAAFPAFCSGAAIVLTIRTILGGDPKPLRTTKIELRKRVLDWLDPRKDDSVPATISRLGSEIDSRKKALGGRVPSSYELGARQVSYKGGPRTYCTAREATVLDVSGTFDQGFKGAVRTVRTNESCEYVDRPCRICNSTAETGELQSLIEKHAQARSLPVQARVQLLGPMADTEAIRALDVPTFQPSGYSQVDDLNRERAAIYELMAEVTRLAVVKEQMEGVAKALEVP